MFASFVNRVTAPFHRKRCPECGHKVRETYCDVCGYKLVEQTRDKYLYRRLSTWRTGAVVIAKLPARL